MISVTGLQGLLSEILPEVNSSPLGWGEESLSEFIELARGNLFATFANKKQRYAKFQNIDEVFLHVLKDLKDPDDPLVALLGLRSHSAFRGSTILVMMGQLVEASAVCRTALENAGYALIVSRTESLGQVFLRRSDGAESRKRVRAEFSHRKVLAALRDVDTGIAERYSLLYETVVDFGAHPNEQAVTGSLSIEEAKGFKKISSQYLHGDGLYLDFSLKTLARAGVCALEILEVAMNREFREKDASASLTTLKRGL